MKHATDAELLLHSEGELRGIVQQHVNACPSCLDREAVLVAELDALAAERTADSSSGHEAARGRLERAMNRERYRPWIRAGIAAALAAMAWSWSVSNGTGPLPRAEWTPGSVQAISREQACLSGGEAAETEIRPEQAATVFARYGILNPEPGAYEVDLLVPPGLGGTVTVDNLWPQPYSGGVWDSRVKDALEDRLQSLVCRGELELAVAQREISGDWIAAYKLRFRTERPLPDHLAFVKDRAWE